METAATTEPFRFHAGTSAASTTSGSETDALVQETRREIAAIVRQTAELARREHSLPRFFAALAERVARAMAAEGVVVWHRGDQGEEPFEVLARAGKTTDLNLPSSHAGCHQRMLHEVGDESQPVVVPATPEAADPTLPANPSDVPVAVVPVLGPTAGPAQYVLEVFLEPDGGPATQRGYLRFAAQMADLASDFLRLHQIRQSQQAEARWQRLTASLPRLHESLAIEQVAARVVDEAAELFDVDRAGLCLKGDKQTRLIAVSHVARLQRKNEEASRIESWAGKAAPDQPRFYGEFEQAETEENVREQPLLQMQAIVALGTSNDYALVLQSQEPTVWETAKRRDLQTFARHAEKALQNAHTFEGIPWARMVSALASTSRRNRFATQRQWLMAALLAILIAVIAGFPVPLIVHSDGELYAANAQRVYAPRDGVVTEVLVEHGQAVQANQVLLRMTDQQLEQQHESLVGERAVLLERVGEIRGAMLGPSMRRREESQRLQAEQRILAEQIDAVDRQLALLAHERSRLVLRSDRDGIIDGWQIRRQLIDRPVQRGDPLLSVIEPRGPWRLETRLPQNRVDLVLAAVRKADANGGQGKATARFHRVALASAPNKRLVAEFDRMGPIVDLGTAEGPVAKTGFLIPGPSLAGVQTGAPATVAIDCGYRPLLFVVFQDFIRTITGKLRMYL